MAREISLSGGDVSVLKALGLSGSVMSGKTLMGRLGGMEGVEIVEALEGLIQLDYVICDQQKMRNVEDLQAASFNVNTAMVRDLRDALTPQKKEVRQTRQRRG